MLVNLEFYSNDSNSEDYEKTFDPESLTIWKGNVNGLNCEILCFITNFINRITVKISTKYKFQQRINLYFMIM